MGGNGGNNREQTGIPGNFVLGGQGQNRERTEQHPMGCSRSFSFCVRIRYEIGL